MVKRALLIGVNEYRIDGANLRGCVNDVANIERLLIKLFEFPATSIKKLVDGQATKKKIEAGIKSLFKGSKAGDVLFLHYSGHGSNTPDLNGDEADRRWRPHLARVLHRDQPGGGDVHAELVT